jgi:PucR C-terminal helix-turn-helix domain/GGDEF-like domain
MSLAAGSNGGAPQRKARAEIGPRLQARRAEIEQAVLTRAYAVSDPSRIGDPEYAAGLRAAVSAAIDYGLIGIESAERNPPPIPAALLVQARLAARNGVSLDTVLRRYFAGYVLLGDFLIEEAESMGAAALKPLLRVQATLFDRLLAAVSEEHARESGARLDTAEERRAELAQRLIAGERLDASELAYELAGAHLGLVAKGPGAGEAIRELAASLDRRLLAIPREEGILWAWLGGRRSVDPAELEPLLAKSLPVNVSLALGEPGEGLGGWRLTHRQAAAALPIALRNGERLVRYADVALLASILQDDLLSTSLRRLYLEPLECARDGGERSKEILRAYFSAGFNVSSTAAALGMSRQAVTKRLRSIEKALGRTVTSCAIHLEAALRQEELDPRTQAFLPKV